MAKFIKVPTFDIYDEETGQWAEPDQWWTEGKLVYQSDILDTDGKPIFLEAMRLRDVSKFKSRLMWLAVRINTERLILLRKAV